MFICTKSARQVRIFQWRILWDCSIFRERRKTSQRESVDVISCKKSNENSSFFKKVVKLERETLFERVSTMRAKFENLINISRFRIKKNKSEVRFSRKFKILDFDKKRRIHVAIMYKKKIQKIQSINLSISNDFTSEDRMNWRKKMIIKKNAWIKSILRILWSFYYSQVFRH